jgi:DNA adenine methylase
MNCKQAVYKSFEAADMRKFRKHVEKLKGKWLVTVDDSPLNRELFSDCTIEPVKTKNRLANNRTHAALEFGELLITPK